MKNYLLLLVTAVVASFAQPASAQVVSQLDQQDVSALLHEEGFASTYDGEKVVWKIDGTRTLILVSDNQRSIQFYCAFSGGANLRKVNDWNQSKRFSRSYIDKDGDPVLELDLDLSGGVTHQRIKNFFGTCKASLDAWIKEVVEQ